MWNKKPACLTTDRLEPFKQNLVMIFSAGIPTTFRCGMKAHIFLNLFAKLKKKLYICKHKTFAYDFIQIQTLSYR